MTYFKPKNMGDANVLLSGLHDDVPVTLGPGVLLPEVCAVGDLRALRERIQARSRATFPH